MLEIGKGDFLPDMLPVQMDEKKVQEAMDHAKRSRQWVMCFIIGTKPCINKFYGAIDAAEQKGLPILIIDSNQHYDSLLTKGLQEFDYVNRISVNLQIRGDLSQKSGELFFKLRWLAVYLKKRWPDVVALPVINGDVIVAAIAPAAWMFTRGEKGVNMEAGLRAMAPSSFRNLHMKAHTKDQTASFVQDQFTKPWELLPLEPYPEQWDTYVSSKACQYHFAPVDLNKEHLLREGYQEKDIFVAGGVVIDAWKHLQQIPPQQSIFALYPKLEKGQWIRIDIHRKENLTKRRFSTIIQGVQKLVKDGFQVNLIGMNATKYAIQLHKLQNIISRLEQAPNFLYTPLWPEFAQVREFYRSAHNLAPITDSGGVQEDMNYWGKPCLTARFSTDRPETVMQAHSNILIPPADPDQFHSQIKAIVQDDALLQSMAKAKKLYGTGFGQSFVKVMTERMKKDHPFTWSQEALGLWKEDTSPVF